MELEHIPFLPPEKEDEFLAQHNLARRQLPNGLTIFKFPVITEEEKTANIQVRFKAGNFFDPPGKTGMHHLLEHLIMDPEVDKKAHLHSVYYNASTSYDQTRIIIAGTANPKVREYGIWNFLDPVYQSVANPFGHRLSIEGALNNEREIVKREMADNIVDKNWLNNYLFHKTLFTMDNPRYYYSAGIKEELDTITINEFSGLAKKVFNPWGTHIYLRTFGDLQQSGELEKELVDRFGLLSNFGNQANYIDPRLYDHCNNNFIGEVVEGGNKNDPTRLVEFVWVLDAPIYTTPSYSLNKLTTFAGQLLQEYVRGQGLSYGAFMQYNKLHKKGIISIGANLATKPHFDRYATNEFLPQVRNLLSGMGAADVTNPYELLKQRAVQVKKSALIDAIENSVSTYDKIIDFEESKRRDQAVTAGDILMQRDLLLYTPPITIIY